MMRFSVVLVASCLVVSASPAAQFGNLGKALGKAADLKQDLSFTDEEEALLGGQISEKLRDRYGVVQDGAVHKYVTLVGSVVAAESSRPGLAWTFVVLDTDGINAFAAPGGYVHITRGALGLIQNEAELADVLAHEIGHVTAKHTVRAIQKSKLAALGATATRRAVLSQAADRGYELLLENNFDRGDEINADKTGVTIANAAGYAPAGLSAFLNRLAERNKSLQDRSGLFASHPDTRARLDALATVIRESRLTSSALVAQRYGQSISYQPVPVASVATRAAPEAPAGTESTGGRLGLSGLAGIGREKSSGQTVSSAGSRGVNPDRDAIGGPVKTRVAVNVTRAEVEQFKQGIAG